ncbi:PrgI family protein [Actinomadura sp. NPDC047616]|uniref:PrgI family protein n=1 Tax=Actinomadura sp. NPDC047616 TaxID=3155914 RepID=UPI003405A570
MTTPDDELLVAKIPADVEMPDKLIAGLTARQVLILGGTGLLAAWMYLLAQDHLPLPMIAAVVFPMVAIGCALALGRRDGLSLDRLVIAGLHHLRLRKALVAAPEGVAPLPAWCKLRGRMPGPLDLPVRAIREDGVLELADGGTAMLVRAGTVSFTLRTPAEQAALVAMFGRWLNSLDAPVQILVQARSADLGGLIDRLEDSAPQLAHPALEQAALEHAGYLRELNTSRDLLIRHVLLVLREQPEAKPVRRSRARDVTANLLARRADNAVRSLSAIGINAEVLHARACIEILSSALSPGEARPPGLASPHDTITAAEADDR